MKIRSKLWIEVEGEPVFGRGRMMLLRAVERYGSINRAAREVNISYRKAWSYISIMEDRLGIKLVERRQGGPGGGGAVITEEAARFIERYARLEAEVLALADRRFEELFTDCLAPGGQREVAGVR